jgi:predicted transcriptional regulator of viral defense system
MAKPLGPLESQFFAYTQMRRLQIVRLGDLVGPLHLTKAQERRLLSQLTKKGLIVRIIRGAYLVPPRLPLGSAWSPDVDLAIDTLMSLADSRYEAATRPSRGKSHTVRYQICGPNAFNRYSLDEQLPVRTYVYNDRFTGDRRIGGVNLTLIKVARNRLGSTEEITTSAGLRLVYSSRVRTLVDAVYDWSRFDSLPRGFEWIRRELATRRIRAENLVEATLRFGNQGTIRRMGFLLEKEGVAESLLRRLHNALRSSTSLISWIPNAPRRGKADMRWRVVDNRPGCLR